MNGYPIFVQAVLDMAPKALQHRRWAKKIARKAGLRNGALLDAGADIAGTFSAKNTSSGFEFTSGDFPDTGSMNRLADLTSYSEARVLVNVAVAGSGTLGVTGGIDAVASLVTEGIATSDWEPIEGDSWSWVSTGVATVGLCQLQVR